MSNPPTHSLSGSQPSHGLPSKDSNSQHISGSDTTETADHPSSSKPDPTTSKHAAEGELTTTSSASATELSSLKVKLKAGLRQFQDFPTPGILFEDIMPLFASVSLHNDLIRALELQVATVFNTGTGDKSEVDVIVGLEARGFLFGPTLALRLGAAFVPVRKKGKLPGECETESFQKEYGADHFQMQSDAIKKGQKVVIMDDIIATGGSASAAGKLVRKLGGDLLGYVFMMELDFLKGRDKLDAPVHTLFAGQEDSSNAN